MYYMYVYIHTITYVDASSRRARWQDAEVRTGPARTSRADRTRARAWKNAQGISRQRRVCRVREGIPPGNV